FFKSGNITSNDLTKIVETNRGNLLIGTKSGLKFFDVLKAEYTDLLIYDTNHRNVYVRDILKNSENEYWIASEHGIYIYNANKNEFLNLTKQYNNPWYISDNAIYTLLKDKEGGIWVGTYFGGLNYYPAPYTPFEKYFPITGVN